MKTIFPNMDSVIDFYNYWQPNSETLYACLPEIILGVLAIFALAFDVVCVSRSAKRACNGFIRAALIALFICVVGGAFPQANGHSLFLLASFGLFTTPVFILCAFLTLNLFCTVRSREGNAEISSPATTHLILIATAAASLLVKTSNFVSFFVLLETLTVCLYALVGSNRNSSYSLEAGVKYLIAGGVSGGLMLFGIVLLYGSAALSGLPAEGGDPLSYQTCAALFQGSENSLGLAGLGMVLAGVLFKLGVFPMQFWIPDTYQGAPTHVTFFLATLSKAVGFFLLAILLIVFAGIGGKLIPVILVCALVSIVYANVTALGQRNVKRLLGLSGVAHAGYLTLGLLAAFSPLSERNESVHQFPLILVGLYLVVYIFSVYPIFSVMTRMPQADDALQDFDDYNALSKNNPLLAGTLAFSLGSLAGIPPTVGFIAKLGLLYVLFDAGFYGSAIIMLGCVVVGIYYYFGWFRAAFSRTSEGRDEKRDYLPVGFCSRIFLIAFAALMILGSLGYWFVLRLFVGFF